MMRNINLLGVLLLFLSACTENKTTNADFYGRIEREEISVVTKVPGKIEEFLVTEGEKVHKGDTIAILDIPEVDAKRAQAQGAIDAADAQYQMSRKGATDGQLKQLEAKVSGLKEQFDFAQKSLDRLSNLLKDSLVSQQQYDEVYAKYQGAKNQYLAAQVEVEEVKNGARIEQQMMALGQRGRALGAMDEVAAAEKEKYLVAPQDMTIETVNLKVGELALPGYPIVSGYLPSTTYFRFTVSEDRMDSFSKDKEVQIRIPYKNNKTIRGKIVLIKALSSYANIATAYPDFDQQKTLFEIKVLPLEREEMGELITQATVVVEP